MAKAIICVVLFAVCLLLNSASAQTWVQTEKNFASILMGVSCISPEHCWIAGNTLGSKNMVWQTTNSGTNWTESNINTLSVFLLSCAADESNQTIATGVGLIDVGEGSGYAPNGIDFEETTGDRVCSSQDSGVVDSGEFYRIGHWSHSHTSGEDKGSGVSWSANQGLSYDHYDWEQPSPVRYGSFVSRDIGFLSGGMWPETNEEEDMNIRRLLALPEDGTYTRLTQRLAVGSNGKMARTPVRARSGDEPNGYVGDIAKTEDGGKTFVNVFHSEGTNASASFYFNGIKCVSKDDCYATAEGLDAQGETVAYVYQTADGGNTWINTLIFNLGSLIGIDVVGENIWVFGGDVSTGDGTVYTSSDNGNTWNLQATFKDSYMIWADMADESHGFCVGESGFSSDGAIWHFS